MLFKGDASRYMIVHDQKGEDEAISEGWSNDRPETPKQPSAEDLDEVSKELKAIDATMTKPKRRKAKDASST